MSGGERYRNAPPVKFRQRYSRSCKGYAHGDRYVEPMKSENLFRRMLLVDVLLAQRMLMLREKPINGPVVVTKQSKEPWEA